MVSNNVGDVFQIKPTKEIELYGLVINNHINNINGDDLILIVIFKYGVNMEESINKGIGSSDLLLPPEIVGKEYWTRGFFYNIAHYEEDFCMDDYGFYSVRKGKIYNEYGNEMEEEPQLLGIYGVSTIIGIAGKVRKELIIGGHVISSNIKIAAVLLLRVCWKFNIKRGRSHDGIRDIF